MKAVLVREFGPPGVLRLEDAPAPSPQEGEVLVALKAVGVNPVESYVRSGKYPRLPELPYVPGTDGAGLIEATGRGVTRFKPGDRVYVYGPRTGAYAERAACEQTRVFPLPSSLSYEQGATIGVPYATAHRALFHHGGARKGETVLVHGGSGGVGTAAIQLARAAGLTVIATGGGPDGVAFVKFAGAHHALDHRAKGYLDAVPGLTGGRGPELVVEMLANANLPADMNLAAPRGRIVVVGSRGPVAIDPRAAMSKDLVVRGMSLWNMTDAERAAVHGALAASFAAGLKPFVGRTLPMSDAARAHEAVMAPGARGKIVLIP